MSNFVWWPDKGYGFEDPTSFDSSKQVKPFVYEQDYYDICKNRELTTVGIGLIMDRATLVGAYLTSDESQDMVDFGVGALGFVHVTRCKGYDINPFAVQRLKDLDQFADPYKEDVDSICFWDSLEHLQVPALALARVKRFVFISLPIHASAEAAAVSKHRKPGEHLWHFTERGLIGWFKEHGFRLVHRDRDEERLGREDIGRYVFERA